jgi:hypothetical protein
VTPNPSNESARRPWPSSGPQVGDIIGWDPLPDGDELVITSVGIGRFVAKRGYAESFHFDTTTSPYPYLIERPTDDL